MIPRKPISDGRVPHGPVEAVAGDFFPQEYPPRRDHGTLGASQSASTGPWSQLQETHALKKTHNRWLLGPKWQCVTHAVCFKGPWSQLQETHAP